MANIPFGGWGMNPQTGRNQRWFNGTWTDGEDPTGGSSFGAQADQFQKELETSVNKYTDELIGEAQGKRDLIIKKLDAEHKMALGNDDTARAEFLEKVADSLEQKIGRIPYDYERYTSRELERYAIESGQVKQNQDLALKKLEADERMLRGEQTRTNQSYAEDLNSRGLLEGQKPQFSRETDLAGANPLAGLKGLAGNQAGALNQDYGNRFNTLNLQKEGVNLSAKQQLEQSAFQNKNTLADLKTNARRDSQDQIQDNTFSKDSANIDFEQRRKALERERDALLRNSRRESTRAVGY